MASKSYSEWKVLGVVALLVVVATAGYIIISDDEGYDWHLGKYQKYEITGSSDVSTFEGTVLVEVVDVDGLMITAKTTFDIYEINEDGRTPHIVMEQWTTYDASVRDAIWECSKTISTNWGIKVVDVCHFSDIDGLTVYVDQKNYELVYETIYVSNGVTLIYILTDTNYFI